jgi:hypothetical protein
LLFFLLCSLFLFPFFSFFFFLYLSFHVHLSSWVFWSSPSLGFVELVVIIIAVIPCYWQSCDRNSVHGLIFDIDLHRLPGADIGCRTFQSAIFSHRMGDYAFRPTIFPVNGFSSIPRYPYSPTTHRQQNAQIGERFLLSSLSSCPIQ